MQARHEGHRERTQLKRLVRDHLHRSLVLTVQAHQLRERGGAIGGAAVARADLGNVDRMIEVRVSHEDADHLALRPQPPIDQLRVRQRALAAHDIGKRHAGYVGVDVDRLALEGEPIAGHPEPFELETGWEIEHARGVTRELALRERVCLRALLVLREIPAKAREVSDQSVHENEASRSRWWSESAG
jgi:hypothetical protein